MTEETNAPQGEPELRAMDLSVNPWLWRNVAMLLLWKFGQQGNQVALTQADEDAMFAAFPGNAPVMAVADTDVGGIFLALVTMAEAEAMGQAYKENREARGIPVMVGGLQ